MVLVLALAALIWFGGARLDQPRSVRLLTLGLLYVAVLAVQVALPEGHPLREATGGSAGEWVVAGILAAAVLAYREGLRRIRGHVRQENRPAAPAAPDPDEAAAAERERYARHIILREIGGAGQKRLGAARVLVVGAGGLGSPVLQYLAAAGVGTIGVIDDDVVERTNLQRQVIHTTARIGLPKVFSAVEAIAAQNPHVNVRPYHRRLTDAIAADLVADYDLILDGTDDIDTRYRVNRAATGAGRTLVTGALSPWEGQVATFAPARGGPCYACIFPQAPAPGRSQTCAEAGVLGPLPGVIGAIMAVEAIKEIVGAGEGLAGRLIIYDALYAETRTIAVQRRPDCPVCRGAAAAE